MVKNDLLLINNYDGTPSFIVWPIDKRHVTLYIFNFCDLIPVVTDPCGGAIVINIV